MRATHVPQHCELYPPTSSLSFYGKSPFGVSVRAFQFLHGCQWRWCGTPGQPGGPVTSSGDVSTAQGLPVSPGQVGLGGWEVRCARLVSPTQVKRFSLPVALPSPDCPHPAPHRGASMLGPQGAHHLTCLEAAGATPQLTQLSPGAMPSGNPPWHQLKCSLRPKNRCLALKRKKTRKRQLGQDRLRGQAGGKAAGSPSEPTGHRGRFPQCSGREGQSLRD